MGPDAEKMMWTVDTASFFEEQRSAPEMLALDIPPALEGLPKSVHVSVLAKQGNKVILKLLLKKHTAA